MKQAIKSIVLPYVQRDPKKKSTKMAAIILDENPTLTISERTVRWYIGLIKKELIAQGHQIVVTDNNFVQSDITFLPTIDDDIGESIDVSKDQPVVDYSIFVDEDSVTHYQFSLRDGEATITEELVDAVFCAYSRSGLNYTKPQIVEALGISYQDFGILTNKLNLSKFSVTLGPNSAATLTEDVQYKKVIDISTSLINKFTDSDNGAAEALIKEYKRRIISLSALETIKDNQMNSLIASLPSITIKSYKTKKNSKVFKKTMQVVLADMHIGMETDNFNFFKARAQIAYMINVINQEVMLHNIEEVNLLLLGDLPHTISGLNHMNNWKDIETNFWGAEAIIKPFELLAELVANTLNLTGIYAVGGNHGRLNHSKEIEPTDEGEKLILYMLDRATPKEVTVKFDSEKMLYTNDSINYICLHGDQGLDKQTGQEIAWLLGTTDKYNLILLGHLHSRIIKKEDDGYNFRKQHCPAFCPTDAYAERLGLRSLPGFLIIKETLQGLPSILDVPLFYT